MVELMALKKADQLGELLADSKVAGTVCLKVDRLVERSVVKKEESMAVVTVVRSGARSAVQTADGWAEPMVRW